MVYIPVNKTTKIDVVNIVVNLIKDKARPYVNFTINISQKVTVNIDVKYTKPLHSLSLFQGVTKISLDYFVSALVDLHIYLQNSSSVFWKAIELLMKLPLTFENCMRFFLICYIISMKLLEDTPVNNFEMSQLMGLTRHDVNRMEFTYLKYVNFNLSILDDTEMYQSEFASED